MTLITLTFVLLQSAVVGYMFSRLRRAWRREYVLTYQLYIYEKLLSKHGFIPTISRKQTHDTEPTTAN